MRVASYTVELAENFGTEALDGTDWIHLSVEGDLAWNEELGESVESNLRVTGWTGAGRCPTWSQLTRRQQHSAKEAIWELAPESAVRAEWESRFPFVVDVMEAA